jgi:hypothetical protein
MFRGENLRLASSEYGSIEVPLDRVSNFEEASKTFTFKSQKQTLRKFVKPMEPKMKQDYMSQATVGSLEQVTGRTFKIS